jgi:tRNA (guanine37-N1)-methyltransferase
MVMMPVPLFAAVESVAPPHPLLLLSAAGEVFTQARAAGLASTPGFSLLCGRYEGVDQRVADHLADGELSIGDYVTAGGEVAALVVIEAVTRLVTGVMGNAESGADESHVDGLLEYPQYTRPAEFRGWAVPEIVRSGDHARVARWRRAEMLHRTRLRRPDLLAGRILSAADEAVLREFPEPAADADGGTAGEAGAGARNLDLPGPDRSG